MPHSPVIGPLYTGRIIVRLYEAIEARIHARALGVLGADWEDLHELANDLRTDEPELYDFIAPLQLSMPRLVKSRPVIRMLEIEDGARVRFDKVQSLTPYYVIDARDFRESHRTLLDALRRLRQVRRAYRELHLVDPAAGDDYSGSQGYLDEAPLGIGARPLIDAGYTGAGIGFIDIEMMWNLNHEDLDDGTPAGKLIHNNNYYTGGSIDCGWHGTAVLGIVIGLPKNGKGIDGIATAARPATLASRWVDASDQWDVAGAIYKVIDPAISAAGDVMLIEVQTASFYPVEIVEHLFIAIQVAVGNGIVVIEAAGNGSHDLDNPPDIAGDDFASGHPLLEGSLDRGSAQFVDSGAILVGACVSAVSGTAPNEGHARWPKSNHGSRVDCHAWGENIPTPGDPGNAAICDVRYNPAFGGTSGATAIIGGAALLLQEIAMAETGSRLTPQAMRARLSDVTTGTPQVPASAPDSIGPMPNLMSGALVPDVFIRDSIVDLGAVPNAAVSSSPDIIVRSAMLPDPDAALGEGSGTEESVPANDAIVPTAVSYVYVRMQNRGLVDAAGAIASVYWSDASTLVAPVDWHLIGTSAPLDVPAGGRLVVTAPIPWDTSGGNLPATGHGCFIAVASHPADPAPAAIAAYNASTSMPTTWSEFRSYLGEHNNVAWRNFTILDANAADENGLFIGHFFIKGAPDMARRFDIDVLIDLPEHTRVSLVVPRILLQDPGSPVERAGKRDDVTEVEVSRHGKLSIPPLTLPRRVRIPCEIRIRGRGLKLDREYAIAVRQTWEGIEVGRVTWALRRNR